MRTFSSTQPEKQEMETDRQQLKEGEFFIITDVIIVPSKKYNKIGKINGYDLITKAPLKYRTTSETICGQIENMIKSIGADDHGKLKEEVKVGVKKEHSASSGNDYLTFFDP